MTTGLFYTFSQNNPGGTFKGPAHYVIIQAESPSQAWGRLSEIVGLAIHDKCECCGDRWDYPYEGTQEPMVYHRTVAEHMAKNEYKSAGERCGAEVAVYTADGKETVYK